MHRLIGRIDHSNHDSVCARAHRQSRTPAVAICAGNFSLWRLGTLRGRPGQTGARNLSKSGARRLADARRDCHRQRSGTGPIAGPRLLGRALACAFWPIWAPPPTGAPAVRGRVTCACAAGPESAPNWNGRAGHQDGAPVNWLAAGRATD